ncbi:MAG: DNA-3-methyladenine glycosylase [Thermoleophilales bacterium]|nr:DNA-3-methyladenine glycosylase [Thermoleophilales bacterium]
MSDSPGKAEGAFPEFLAEPADLVAEKLLGCFFERTIGQQRLLARIVETEAYDQDDAASHSHRGRTARNEVMFGPSGRLYVYFTYGMHYCSNVVTGEDGHGSGVLIRAAEPVEGISKMEKLRGLEGRNLANGPAKLCQALGIDLQLGGHDLRKDPLRLLEGGLLPGENTTRTTRIGISKARHLLRRHYITGNPYVSRR